MTVQTNSPFRRTADGKLWYFATDMLEGPYRPIVGKRNPLFKTAGVPAELLERETGAYLPIWGWTHPRKFQPGATALDLDVCGAYLAAASSGRFAHGAHEHTGAMATLPRIIQPGYYLIDVHTWQVDIIVSPLGDDPRMPDRVWVKHPTLELLRDLSEQSAGYWPGVTVHDSYTAPVTCRLRKWTDAVKADRTDALSDLRFDPEDADAQERYEAIKDGYSIAVQMIEMPHGHPKKKNKYYRPEWHNTVHAQHAATTWRKAWKAAMHGCSPVAMGDTDEMTFLPDDLAELMNLATPPFKMDETGISIGSLKIKREPYVIPAPRTTDENGETDE